LGTLVRPVDCRVEPLFTDFVWRGMMSQGHVVQTKK
jgi:hypothetical protein